MSSTQPQSLAPAATLADYLQLTKPRVVALIVFTAVAGMGFAYALHGGAPSALIVLCGALGIGLSACGAAAANCLLERRIDASMNRTMHRATATGRVHPLAAGLFALALLGAGLGLLALTTNALTVWLTLATFVGYAFVYTVLLKPNTPQNIVIGGASGAMPPVLGWTAATGELGYQPLLLFLIIFVWTPPHFWALALCRLEEYGKARVPMLPVTHGERFTRLQILLYSIVLAAATLLPWAVEMAGALYLTVALAANGYFLWLAARVWLTASKALCWRLFNYSGLYLMVVFMALMVDALSARFA